MISDRIFELINQRGLSQKEFSERTSIPQSTISDWKKKGNTPSADKIIGICEVLDVSPYYLLSGSEMSDRNNRRGYFVSKETEEGKIIEAYTSMEDSSRQRLLGYAMALSSLEEH